MSVLPPATEVEMANLALARLGGRRAISSLESPTTDLEELVASHFALTRRRLLRGPRVYNFAKKYAQLTVDATEVPDFGYESAFLLPNDFLRLLTIGEITEGDPQLPDLFDVVRKWIYTDGYFSAVFASDGIGYREFIRDGRGRRNRIAGVRAEIGIP